MRPGLINERYYNLDLGKPLVGFVGDLRRGMADARWVRVANARRCHGFEDRRLWQADVISFFSCFAQVLPRVCQSRMLFPLMERDSQ